MADEQQFIDQCKVLHEGLYQRMGKLAEEAADKAVKQTLLIVGIDVSDPLKAQHDFAILREVSSLASDAEFRKDLEVIRAWRLRMSAIQNKSVMTIVGAAVTGLLAALWLGLTQKLH